MEARLRQTRKPPRCGAGWWWASGRGWEKEKGNKVKEAQPLYYIACSIEKEQGKTKTQRAGPVGTMQKKASVFQIPFVAVLTP